jgi:peptidoglycan/xylan/chitin deacetylase (PgdA/CDA1 family)/SAM-dependent methyltransferase
MTADRWSVIREGPIVLVVEHGYQVLPGAASLLADALETGALASGGAIRIESEDSVHSARWDPRGRTALDVLADPRSVPPVWATAGRTFASLSIDRSLHGLELADAWLQLATAGTVDVIDAVIARHDAARRTRWERLTADPGYADVFRRFLLKHRDLVVAHMRDLLTAREIAFGTLRTRHQALLARRDIALAELERVRAATAHHRAFLSHHGLDGLDWGSFDQPHPVARDWGYARGGPVDRRYIRAFVAGHSSDIHGRVLEIQEDDLTKTYGGARVERADVLDLDASNPRATIVADLRSAERVPGDTYHCIVLTQTAHVIDDADAALAECHRLLKPGGVLLATFPCVSRVCLEYGPRGDFWRVTPAGARVLAERAFGSEVDVEAFGNVKTTMAFLHGLGEQEIADADYELADPYNPMLVGVRARKLPPKDGSHEIGIGEPSLPVASAFRPKSAARGLVLLYHRIETSAADPFDLSVPAELFAQHLEVIAERGTVVDLHWLLTASPEDLPERPIALTFDDGYSAHLTDVLPILERANAPATFFLTSAGLDREVEYWWDALERVNPPNLRVLHDRLVRASLPDRDSLLAPYPSTGAVRRRPLRAEEARRLGAAPGVTIGAHTVNHLLLTAQPDDLREREMTECRRALEALTGKPVTLFAYPYGAVDEPTARRAREHFDYALDCTPATVDVSFDAARVPRLDVKGWTREELAERLDALFAPATRDARISFLP